MNFLRSREEVPSAPGSTPAGCLVELIEAKLLRRRRVCCVEFISLHPALAGSVEEKVTKRVKESSVAMVMSQLLLRRIGREIEFRLIEFGGMEVFLNPSADPGSGQGEGPDLMTDD